MGARYSLRGFRHARRRALAGEGRAHAREAIEPDVLVPLTSADRFAGVDPVLERALRE
jgi:hypothetical protein